MFREQVNKRIKELSDEHAKHVTIVQTCRAQIEQSTLEAARLKGAVEELKAMLASLPVVVDAGPAPDDMPETPKVNPEDINPETATVIPIFKGDQPESN